MTNHNSALRVQFIGFSVRAGYVIILVARGAVVHLGERCVRIAKVGGSNPPGSILDLRTLKRKSMNRDDEPQTKEFRSLLEELRKQLLDASMYFDIWEQIWPTAQVVDIINRYKGFFQPTRKALFDQFCIRICNVISNDRRLPSFHKIFKMLDTNPNLALEIDVRSLRKRLKQHRAVLTAINDYRNTKAAHWDITNQIAERKPVLFGDSRRMLKELQDIFNEICGAATNGEWSFKPVEHGDTDSLLNHLKELKIIHRKRIDELRSTIKS